MKINIAKLSQLFFLLIFCLLFINTEYRGKDEISLAINSFFRTNPLVVISYIIANWAIPFIFLPGLLLIFATIFLGRFFCGWICPLGTIIDIINIKIKKTFKIKRINAKFKYFLLIVILTSTFFGINITGLFDPIAILVRFLTFSIYPIIGYSATKSWASLYTIIEEKRDVIEPAFIFFKNYFLPFRTSFYPLAFFSCLLFGFIIFLEKYERRNWCKNICPLGTLLGILGTSSIFKRLPVRLCDDCKECNKICPTAFDSEILNQNNCIMCMNCKLECKNKRVHFKPLFKSTKTIGFDIDRRLIFSGLISGLFASKIFNYNDDTTKTRILRPPGVKDEKEFLKKCVRCGECIKICLKNALYPSVTESGVYGVATPLFVMRKGYCEYNCTLCGQVCPTKAIPELSLPEKQKAVIGIAVFDKNHCLPYAKKTNCIVCQEHCPVPEKAIKLETFEDIDYNGKKILLKRPYVVDNLCIGCGICEYVCPLTKAGVEVFSKKDERLI